MAITLDQQSKTVRISDFEVSDERIFKYFDSLPEDQRDEVLKRALQIGVVALLKDRDATFLPRPENEPGTELEAPKLIDEQNVVPKKITRQIGDNPGSRIFQSLPETIQHKGYENDDIQLSMDKLEKILRIYAQLKELGDYDTTIAGAIGEVYAEVKLGLRKAPRGTKGIDGWINERGVSIKTKEHDKRLHSEVYGQISNKNLDNKDLQDILIVILDENNIPMHYGPCLIEKLNGRSNEKSKRFFLNDIKKSMA